MKYFTKPMLIAAALAGAKRGYNRQFDVQKLSKKLARQEDDTKFPVTFALPHEHIAGMLVEPHMRVQIVLNDQGETGLIDVDQETYNHLPEKEIEIP